jgi:MarR family transcriptional regulator, transcriptional regulator for hemolysin
VNSSDEANKNIPIGTKALILSKFYYGVLSKRLEHLKVERYYTILYFLYTNNGCSQQHICNNLAIDKTAMVKVIDYLVRNGLIERKKNPADRREQFITLTKQGARETEQVVNAFLKVDEEIFKSIRKQDRQVFTSVIDDLTLTLKAMPGNDLFFHYKKTAKKTGDINSQTRPIKNKRK